MSRRSLVRNVPDGSSRIICQPTKRRTVTGRTARPARVAHETVLLLPNIVTVLSLSLSCCCRCCRVGPRDQSPSRESGSDLTPSLSCCAKEATPGRSFGSRPIPVRRSRLRGDGGEPEKLGLYCISPVREGFLWKVRAKSLFRRARRGQPALRRALLLWRCLASSKLAYDENPSDLSLSEFPAQAECRPERPRRAR